MELVFTLFTDALIIILLLVIIIHRRISMMVPAPIPVVRICLLLIIIFMQDVRITPLVYTTQIWVAPLRELVTTVRVLLPMMVLAPTPGVLRRWPAIIILLQLVMTVHVLYSDVQMLQHVIIILLLPSKTVHVLFLVAPFLLLVISTQKRDVIMALVFSKLVRIRSHATINQVSLVAGEYAFIPAAPV